MMTAIGSSEPKTPSNIPSIKNGHLINPFAAPTSFIIPISLLRAIIVSLIVLEIKKIAVNTRPMIRTTPIVLAYLLNSKSLFTTRSEEHTSELQSRGHLVCRLLLEKKKEQNYT